MLMQTKHKNPSDQEEAGGETKINLQVRATNQDVVDLYLGLGYAIEDRVSMGKRIQPS